VKAYIRGKRMADLHAEAVLAIVKKRGKLSTSDCVIGLRVDTNYAYSDKLTKQIKALDERKKAERESQEAVATPGASSLTFSDKKKGERR